MFHAVMTRLYCAGLLGLALLLSGCSGAMVVSAQDENFHASRLPAAHVVWVKAPAVKINVSKSGYGYQPIITAQESSAARLAIFVLNARLEKFAPERIQQQLASNGVADGAGATIEIEPVGANYIVGGARGLFVRVSVREPGAEQAAWSVTIRTFGLLSEKDDVLLENFINTAVAEMRKAGWLG